MSFTASVCTPWADLNDLLVCTACGEKSVLVSQGGPVPDSVALENLIIASNLINRLTAQQFGVCPNKVRPCCSADLNCVPIGRTQPYGPYKSADGEWYNLGGDGVSTCTAYVCGPQRIPQLELSVFPIDTITEILVGGAILPTTSYRVDDYRYVVRTDGSPWPSAQNLLLDDTEVGTWSIAYTAGIPPPPEGVRAVAELACQLTLSCAPASLSNLCMLPDNVTAVTRQGISYDIGRLEDSIRYRTLGLPDVDRFILNVNPNGHLSMARVISPTFNRNKARQVNT